ncbi:DNA polymerase III subunit chi [Parasphingopyxis sp.]|uniref:DNA polymerase III subunit chi n=1 Tax=Parasphingopyxis sp. TaxID=1920299 RepID=UPI002622071D|nr:DNA polymerase III subunit chi [Parasphingopyxis sp.]
MQVDFYQLAGTPIDTVAPQLAAKVLESGERLLIVAEDAQIRDVLDEALWTRDPASFLAHGGPDDRPEIQPILLTEDVEPKNGARFTMLADGIWRDAALEAERVFYLFDADRLNDARTAWRNLSARDDVEPRYWKQDGGRWRQGP